MNTLLVCILIIFCASSGFARDIDLDGIYISARSFYYPKLLEKKIEAYENANSRYIDGDVIFAHWLSGFELVYIKEIAGINKIYVYNRIQKNRREISSFKGIVTASQLLFNGGLLILKKLTIRNNKPKGEMVIVNIHKKSMLSIKRNFSFLDFSISPGDNSILIHNNKGIIEYDPATNNRELIIPAQQFYDIKTEGNPTIAFMAPNRRSTLIINGSGGNYRAKISRDSSSWSLSGVSSVSEIFWLDNDSLVFRKGGPGYYSVNMYNVEKKTTQRLLQYSYNTNICYSKYPKILSFLNDQVIYFYSHREKSMVRTGLEGEDVYFSPDGTWFSSLFQKKLFITNIYVLKKRNFLLKSTFKDIINLYKKVYASRRDWINAYSEEYIRRKIALYKSML